MDISPYLMFQGNCEEAFKFYHQCLGGNLEAMIPHEGTPAAEHTPAEWHKKILHARLNVNGQLLMGSDCPPDLYKTPEGFSVSLQIKDPAEAERIFQTLAEGGRVNMPLQQTFWAARFGMLVDRYGIPWMVNCA